MTDGTNTPAILSAMRAMGALEELASSTSLMIWLMVESSPVFSTTASMYPCRLMVAEITISPACLATGMLSPVMADSSTLVCPLRMRPSAGMRSPGFTASTSPLRTSAIGTTCGMPPRMTVACFGARSISFSIALEVRPWHGPPDTFLR